MSQDPSRYPQLDGMRAIAMCGVLYVHLVNPGTVTEHLRVSLFFVISGFLITHMLFLAKDSGQAISIGRFYLRRALRLFPALLALVIVATALQMDDFHLSALWHLAQMSNIYFVLHHPTGQWHPWIVGHLWSLNVVEQFYLVAPFLVMFLSRRRLLVFALSVWVLVVFVRVNAAHLGAVKPFVWNVLCYDPIFAGVIARLLLYDPRAAAMTRSRKGTCAALAVAASPFFMWADFGHSESYRLLMQPALALLVMQSFLGFGGVVGSVLASRPARFLAQISYGVFIYHLGIWWMVIAANPDMQTPSWPAFWIVSPLSIMVASISYYAMEQPISRLKRRFPVGRDVVKAAADVPMAAQDYRRTE